MTSTDLITEREKFRHEAFFYAGTDEFLDDCVGFISGGRDAGEPVLVAVDAAKATALIERLGGTPDGVEFIDMAREGRNPGRIISLWHDFSDRHRGEPIRGIGEPVWPGRDGHEMPECHQHEHLLNHAFAGRARFTLRCPYDLATLDDDVIREAQRSHPLVRTAGSAGGSPVYTAIDAAALLAAPLSPVPGIATAEAVGRESLRRVRTELSASARRAGCGDGRADDVALVASEVLANSLEHTHGSVTLRSWVADGRLTFQVEDDGRIADPLLGRRRPEVHLPHGRGLWLVHELADLVQIRSGPGAIGGTPGMGDSGGTVVRVAFDLPPR